MLYSKWNITAIPPFRKEPLSAHDDLLESPLSAQPNFYILSDEILVIL